MKRSVTAVLTGIGVVVAVMLTLALWVRVAAPRPEDYPTSLSGERATRSYDFTGFTGVDMSGQWQVTLVRGDAWAVEVSYPTELERFMTVRREGDALVLGHEFRTGPWSDFGSNERLAVSARVVMPALKDLDLSGASKVDLSGFDGAELEIDASGASSIEGKDSRYDTLELSMSGAGSTDLSGVTITDARVDISGANAITLRMAGGSLSGSLSGASRLRYFGTVARLDVDTSGIAGVEHRD
jgi:hypothetical protein